MHPSAVLYLSNILWIPLARIWVLYSIIRLPLQIEQNDEAYKFKGNKKEENGRLKMSIEGSPPSEHTMATLPWVRLNLSYNKSIETCSVKSGNIVFQSPWTLKIMNSQEEKTNPIRKSESTSHSCCGMWLRLPPRPGKLMEAKGQLKRCLPFSRRTSTLPNKKFNRWLQLHVASQNLSGSMCSRERQSTSTSSSVISTTLPLLRRMWAALEEQKSVSEKQIQLERYKWVGTGMSPGTWPLAGMASTACGRYESSLVLFHF